MCHPNYAIATHIRKEYKVKIIEDKMELVAPDNKEPLALCVLTPSNTESPDHSTVKLRSDLTARFCSSHALKYTDARPINAPGVIRPNNYKYGTSIDQYK